MPNDMHEHSSSCPLFHEETFPHHRIDLPVRVSPIHIIKLFKGLPSIGKVFGQGRGLGSQQTRLIDMQVDGQVRIGVANGSDMAPDFDVELELFPYFPLQSLGFRFAWFHFPTGKFPLCSCIPSPMALGAEDPTFVGYDRRYDLDHSHGSTLFLFFSLFTTVEP